MTPEKATRLQELHPELMVIDSECFAGTQYIYVPSKGIVIDAGISGRICISSKNARELISEFDLIVKTYIEE